MGLARALVFSVLAIIPGIVLSLLGWVLSGSPEDWNEGLFLACYGPFFGCIAAGFCIGWKSVDDVEMGG